MQPDNKTVHGLWIGETLSPMEVLTIKSFLYHGHEFHLWLYNPIDLTGFSASSACLPVGMGSAFPPEDGSVLRLIGGKNLSGLIPEDANQIIPANEVFAKKNSDPACGGIGKGSYGSPFSDMFRYKLLYEKGGWWTDMDVTCLKPLDFSEPYFFRDHPVLQIVGTVMKCPKGSEIILPAYERTKASCSSGTTDWLLPNKILNEEILKRGLMNFRRAGVSNRDIWKETAQLIKYNRPVPEDYYFLHWMNEEWRVRGIDKNVILPDSMLALLMKKFDIPFGRGNWFTRMKNRVAI